MLSSARQIMATDSAARAFFSSPHFAVVGASSDPQKFGHKIFKWYTHHALPVTPINPSAPTITASPPPDSSSSTSSSLETYPTIPTVSALPSPSATSISIITPPRVTLKVLQEAKAAGVAAVWLQPGSFDDESFAFAMREWVGKAVAGEGGRGGEGWCVLVDGEGALRSVERQRKGKVGGKM